MCEIAATLYQRRDSLKKRLDNSPLNAVETLRGILEEMRDLDAYIATHTQNCVPCDQIRRVRRIA